jgi:hypothetical protein
MKPGEPIDRREFASRSLLAALVGVVVTITGCDDDDDPMSPTPNDETGTISDNHGHTAVVTSAQLTAGGAVALNIQGSATHTHTVDLTAAEVTQVRDGQRVSKVSTTTDGHTHTVTFN